MKTLFLLLLPAVASATTYYVDSSSVSNSQGGLTAATAWKNLWMVNINVFRPGDYILLKRGSYWNEPLVIPSAGTQDLPITFDAYGTGSSPIIDGTHLLIPANNGLVTVQRGYITLKNLEITNSGRDGINVSNVNGISISNVLVHYSQFNGIYAWNASNLLIRASEIANNAQNTSAS